MSTTARTTHAFRTPTLVLLLACILAFSAFMPAASAAAFPNVVVAEYAITDGTLAVGKDFTLTFTLQNTGASTCALTTTTTIQAGTPFITRGITTIPAGDLCGENKTRTVSFPMRIDPTATGGFYQVIISTTYENNLLAQYSNTNTINLFVDGSPAIAAEVVNANPTDVYPGDSAKVTIAIDNTGPFAAQAVTARLTADAPVEVKWSGAYATLSTLSARTSRTATFAIEVPKSAAAKDYPMLLHVQYLDENLAQQTADIPLTLHVREKAQFTTADAGSDALFANQNSRTVRLTVTNTGTDTAYKARINIQPQFPFSTDGSVRYIDQLAPGAATPVDFVVTTDKDATVGTYSVDAIVDFEDKDGKKLQDTAPIALTIQQKSIVRAVFLDYWFLWLIVLVIVAIRVMKTRGKKH